MSKHTPGPWRWAPKDELAENDVAVLENLQDKICDFGNSEQYYPSEGNPPNEADRALIAAAPDLYAACQRAFAVLRGESFEVDPRSAKAFAALDDALTAALEKAGGQ